MWPLLVNFTSSWFFFGGGGFQCVQVHVSMEHLRVVHVPQQGISLRVQDKVSPLEAAAVLLLLDVQKAAYTVQPVHVRHAEAITYHWQTRKDRQTLQSAARRGKKRRKSHNTDRRTDTEDKPSFIYNSNTHTNSCICAEREEERDQLILSSFSCDMIEAEQQTPKPEAERRPPPQPKITDCAQDLHTRTFPLARAERRRRGTCM